MKRLFVVLGGAVAALAAYLCLWPVPIDAESWQVPPTPDYTGVHAVNDRLTDLREISLDGERGPEHVALGPEGKLYAAVASGKILRMNPDGSAQEVFADTGGRALGFDFDAAGNLIVADGFKGLLAIDPDGEIQTLVDETSPVPVHYANSVVAGDNKLYFTDSSRRFTPATHGGGELAAMLDLLEQSSTGRVLAYDLERGTPRVVAENVSFANGIALSRDEQALFVVEMGRYRVWKIDAAAENIDIRQEPAQASVLLDNLPGFPDNLMRGLDGRIWLGLVGPRNADVDAMADKPFLRELALRLPSAMRAKPEPYGHVLAFTEEGRIVADLQDPHGNYSQTTGATETPDRLYVHNLNSDVLGWRPRNRRAEP